MSTDKLTELAHLYNDEIHQLGLRLLELQERIDKAREILEPHLYKWNFIKAALDALEGK